jgi:hypothetical protein
VPVGVGGDGHAGVAEALRHGPRVRSLGNHERGVRVTEIMECRDFGGPDRATAGLKNRRSKFWCPSGPPSGLVKATAWGPADSGEMRSELLGENPRDRHGSVGVDLGGTERHVAPDVGQRRGWRMPAQGLARMAPDRRAGLSTRRVTLNTEWIVPGAASSMASSDRRRRRSEATTVLAERRPKNGRTWVRSIDSLRLGSWA